MITTWFLLLVLESGTSLVLIEPDLKSCVTASATAVKVKQVKRAFCFHTELDA
jgi:hypothetical protein